MNVPRNSLDELLYSLRQYFQSNAIVFIYSLENSPVLHSFPTRRSSDLMLDLDVFQGPFDLLLALVMREEIELARSEEHTSELQSRLHLVCRLLLEKKNLSWSQPANCPPLRRLLRHLARFRIPI